MAEPRIDPKHIVSLQGKQYVLWSGLLDAASKAGLKSIEVTLLQFPSAENGHLAVSEAIVTFEDGRLFKELGDASPANVGTRIAPHICRMSATRAKGRALRDALNIGETMLEELGPDADEAPRQNGARNAPEANPASLRVRHAPEPAPAETAACIVCSRPVAAPVATAARKEFGSVYCVEHGKEARLIRAQAAVDSATGKVAA